MPRWTLSPWCLEPYEPGEKLFSNKREDSLMRHSQKTATSPSCCSRMDTRLPLLHELLPILKLLRHGERSRNNASGGAMGYSRSPGSIRIFSRMRRYHGDWDSSPFPTWSWHRRYFRSVDRWLIYSRSSEPFSLSWIIISLTPITTSRRQYSCWSLPEHSYSLISWSDISLSHSNRMRTRDSFSTFHYRNSSTGTSCTISESKVSSMPSRENEPSGTSSNARIP